MFASPLKSRLVSRESEALAKKVLVIGDYINDVVVRPLGITRHDTDVRAEIEMTSGGSAANFACWLATLGLEVTLVSRVSERDVAQIGLDLSRWDVNAQLQADPELPTGSIVAVVEGEARTFFTQRGANQKLSFQDLKVDRDFDLVYLSGYSVAGIDDTEGLVQFLQEMCSQGIPIAVDPGSAGFIADFSVNRFLEIVDGADFFFPSLQEGALLTGESQPDVIAKGLAERFGEVALTLGASGAIAANSFHLIHSEAEPAELVDAIGAGDAFAAGYLAQRLQGNDLTQALGAANRLGALAVGRSGGRPALS